MKNSTTSLITNEEERALTKGIDQEIDFEHNVQTGQGKIHTFIASMQHLFAIIRKEFGIDFRKLELPMFYFISVPDYPNVFMFTVNPDNCPHLEKLQGIVLDDPQKGYFKVGEFVENASITVRGDFDGIVGVTFDVDVHEYKKETIKGMGKDDFDKNIELLKKAGYPFNVVDGQLCQMPIPETFKYATKIKIPTDIKSPGLKKMMDLLQKYTPEKIVLSSAK